MGTHRPTLAADRNICTACDKPVFADEFHFIFGCDKLKDIRTKYIPRHHTLRPSIHTFITLLQSNDLRTLINLSKFIKLGSTIYYGNDVLSEINAQNNAV